MTEKVRGKVKHLYVDGGGAFIELDNPVAVPTGTTSGVGSVEVGSLETQPKDGYFRLNQSQTNFNAFYALALSAAVNRYELVIRTVRPISSFAHAEVSYIEVYW